MTKLTNAQSDVLSELAVKTTKARKLASQMAKLKKECEALVSELETTAKENKGRLANGEHAVTFVNRKGGGFEVKKWRKYGVDKIISL
jgi:phosphoketolase